MLRKGVVVAALAFFAFGALSSANAAVYTESFEASPFSVWQSGWFGVNSNAVNYYSDPDDRGNNPDGIWIADTTLDGGTPVDIVFNAGFAATLSSFALDVAGFSPTTLTFYDQDFNVLSATSVTLTLGAFTDPGVYSHYSVTSTNGIGGFSFSGAATGNTSIDNLEASTEATSAVPESSTWAMIILGFGGVGFMAYRRSRKDEGLTLAAA
jgi:hypothetical protein